MRITSTGNVGIGTTSPLAPLHTSLVSSATINEIGAIFERTGGPASGISRGIGIVFKDQLNATLVAGVSGIRIGPGNDWGGGLGFFTNAASSASSATFANLTERMRIDAAGNVGIGTTSPTSTLTVAGTCNVTGVLTGRTNVTVQATSLNPVVAQTTYIVTATGITLTLPASPTTGDRIGFQPASSSINSYTIARNGNTIMGLSSDFTVNSSAPFDLIYTGSGWVGANGAVSLQNLTGYSYNFYL